jgi:NAD-dependent SIR2 family protein deacetylase
MMSNTEQELQQLQDFITRYPRIVALTGAGISAGSGIATYRDAAGRWLYSTPIQHREFLHTAAVRQRYWTRSWFGWPAVRDARSNAAHRAIATLEQQGVINLVITQNVDRLHQRAGSSAVIDLHGRLDRVQCLDCAAFTDREVMQQRLARANPHLTVLSIPKGERPDGDMALPDAMSASTRVPACEACGGILMPDVVFFGGSVPADRVTRARAALAAADALLVIGSSLQVYSGFRFCRQAATQGKALAIVNPGQTRADALATLRLRTPCETLLDALVRSNISA